MTQQPSLSRTTIVAELVTLQESAGTRRVFVIQIQLQQDKPSVEGMPLKEPKKGVTRKSGRKTQCVRTDRVEHKDPKDAAVFQLGTGTTAPIFLDMELNGKMVRMKSDTGAAVSVIIECTITHSPPVEGECVMWGLWVVVPN